MMNEKLCLQVLRTSLCNSTLRRVPVRHVQSGAALLVSLLILLVLSMVGLAAMRGGLLQNLMSANTTQDTMAYQAADSAIGAFMLSANNGSPAIPAFLNAEIMANPRTFTGNPRADLTNVANAAGWVRCLDRDGNLRLADCGALDTENGRAGQVTAQVSVGFFKFQPGTPAAVCPEGSDATVNKGTLKCHIFQIVGTANVGGAARTANVIALGVHLGAAD